MHIFGNGILSTPFHCHVFTRQWDSFNALSLSWLHKAVGFFQCLVIVMASQGSGVLSMSFHCHGFTGPPDSFNVRHCHGFTGQWDSFNVRHCHGFAGQWDSFNVLSLSWLHRAGGFFQCPSLSWFHRAVGFFPCPSLSWLRGAMNGILSMSFHCHGFTGQGGSEGNGILYFNVFPLSWFHTALGFCQCLVIVIMNYCYRFQCIVAASFQCQFSS